MVSQVPAYQHLLLVALICGGFIVLKTKAKSVETNENLEAQQGSNVTVTCDAASGDSTVVIVYWKKNTTNVLTYQVTKSVLSSADQVKYNIGADNTSLVLLNVDKEDKGVYHCKVLVTSGDSPTREGANIYLTVTDGSDLDITEPNHSDPDQTKIPVSGDPNQPTLQSSGKLHRGAGPWATAGPIFAFLALVLAIALIIAIIFPCREKRQETWRWFLNAKYAKTKTEEEELGTNPATNLQGKEKEETNNDQLDNGVQATATARGRNGILIHAQIEHLGDANDLNLITGADLPAPLKGPSSVKDDESDSEMNINLEESSEEDPEKNVSSLPKMSLLDFDPAKLAPLAVQILMDDYSMLGDKGQRRLKAIIFSIVKARLQSVKVCYSVPSYPQCSTPLSQSSLASCSRSQLDTGLMQSMKGCPKDPDTLFAEGLVQKLKCFDNERERDICELIITNPKYQRSKKKDLDSIPSFNQPSVRRQSSQGVGDIQAQLITLHGELKNALQKMNSDRKAEVRIMITQMILESYQVLPQNAPGASLDASYTGNGYETTFPSEGCGPDDRLVMFWVGKIDKLQSEVQHDLISQIEEEIIYHVDDEEDDNDSNNSTS